MNQYFSFSTASVLKRDSRINKQSVNGLRYTIMSGYTTRVEFEQTLHKTPTEFADSSSLVGFLKYEYVNRTSISYRRKVPTIMMSARFEWLRAGGDSTTSHLFFLIF